MAARAADIKDPVESLRAAFDTFLDLAYSPEVRQIIVIDALSVVGLQKWREIDERQGFGRIKEALQLVAAAGRMPADMVDVFAHMLLAALLEVAFPLGSFWPTWNARTLGTPARSLGVRRTATGRDQLGALCRVSGVSR